MHMKQRYHDLQQHQDLLLIMRAKRGLALMQYPVSHEERTEGRADPYLTHLDGTSRWFTEAL